MQLIDLKRRCELYQDQVDAAMSAVMQHGRGIMGPEVAELEAAPADYADVAHCVTVSSSTTSLEIALQALGVGPGDEVITEPFTWIGSSEVISEAFRRNVPTRVDSPDRDVTIVSSKVTTPPRKTDFSSI